MAQPTVDLPDPTEMPTQDNTASADDLLAQLAGDEIDRLLAEADVELPPDGPVADAETAATGEMDLPRGVPADLPLSGDAVDSAATATTAAAVDDSPLSNDAADQAPQDDATESAAPQPITTPDPIVASPDAAVASHDSPPTPPSAAEELAAELDAEAGAPRAAAAAVEASLPEVLDEALAISATDDAPVPVLLRPLEWLNRPFAYMADETRGLLGKIAIITLLNAVAVLIYVLFFRR